MAQSDARPTDDQDIAGSTRISRVRLGYRGFDYAGSTRISRVRLHRLSKNIFYSRNIFYDHSLLSADTRRLLSVSD